jgi:hypothetical protein
MVQLLAAFGLSKETGKNRSDPRAPDIEPDGDEDDQADGQALHRGGDGIEVQPILHHHDDQRADQGRDDAAPATGEARAANHRCGDGLKLDQPEP